MQGVLSKPVDVLVPYVEANYKMFKDEVDSKINYYIYPVKRLHDEFNFHLF
jgi:hypothetical protein